MDNQYNKLSRKAQADKKSIEEISGLADPSASSVLHRELSQASGGSPGGDASVISIPKSGRNASLKQKRIHNP